MSEKASVDEYSSAMELASEIIRSLNETTAPSLIEQVVIFIGNEKAQEFFNQTLLIEKNGGMKTKAGDRRRTPGGVFLTLVKNNVSEVEQEILFPSGRDFPIIYFQSEIEKLSVSQLRIGITQIENKLQENSIYLDNTKRAALLERKRLLLQRIENLKTSEASQNISDIRQAVNNIEDSDEKKEILKRLEKLEKIGLEKADASSQTADVELERKKMLIQTEADERRTQTRLRVYEKFLAKESVASIIGSILLVILAITLIVAMFVRQPESEIIKNAFLVLLGYFFGQTSNKKEQETHENNSTLDKDK